MVFPIPGIPEKSLFQKKKKKKKKKKTKKKKKKCRETYRVTCQK